MAEVQRNRKNEILDAEGKVLGKVAVQMAAKLAHQEGQVQASRSKAVALEAAGGMSDGPRQKERNHSVERDAKLWRARQHYRQNEGAYRQLALEEATAAGEEIELGRVANGAQPSSKPAQDVPRNQENETLDAEGNVLDRVNLGHMARIREQQDLVQKADAHRASVEADGEVSYGPRATVARHAVHRDAAMWRAYDHYRQNEAAYQQRALAEATAAGTYDGLEAAQQAQMTQLGAIQASKPTEHRAA